MRIEFPARCRHSSESEFDDGIHCGGGYSEVESLPLPEERFNDDDDDEERTQ